MIKTKAPALPFTQRLTGGAPPSLVNDGQLSLFFVGVGSAFAKKNFQTNLLIVKGDDHLLVDCGTKTPQAFHDLGLPLAKIRNFYLTHSHADHVGGLEEAMLVGRYIAGAKPHVWITEPYQNHLWEHSLKGGSAFNETSEGRSLDFGDYWQVHRPRWLSGFPREAYAFEVGSLKLTAFRTMHFPSHADSWERSSWSTGLIIDDRILFTSDTRFDRSLLEDFLALYPIEAIFHDCQLTPPGGVHASLDELSQLPEEWKAKTVLMHYGDDWERHQDRVRSGGFIGLAQPWVFYDFSPKRQDGS